MVLFSRKYPAPQPFNERPVNNSITLNNIVWTGETF